MTTYTVKHFYNNPRNNREYSFDNKKDALEEYMKMYSDDKNDSQCSTIESSDGKLYKKRRWRNQRSDKK